MNSIKQINLHPSQFSGFRGKIQLEISKSLANRALLLQALSKHSFEIENIGNSDDVLLMQKALNSTHEEVDLGMAGTALRFLTAGFSVLPGTKVITGHPRLKERPISPLIEALRKLGAKITYLEKEEALPIKIEGGNMHGGKVEMAQNTSSQFISALMMIAPFLKNGLTIDRLGKLNSQSYIELTRGLMKEMHLEIKMHGNEIQIPESNPKISSYKVEGDWSSAAYWMAFVVLILDAKVILKGLKEDSFQGDQKFLEIMSHFSFGFYWEDDDLVIYHDQYKRNPSNFSYDCSEIPDQAQTLVFLCVCLGVDVNLKGLETLNYKESNRIEAMYTELTKLGLHVERDEDTISIKGSIQVKHAEIATYNDHRMAMAAALLGTRIEVDIEDPEVVSKSYPSFWNDLDALTSGSLFEK